MFYYALLLYRISTSIGIGIGDAFEPIISVDYPVLAPGNEVFTQYLGPHNGWSCPMSLRFGALRPLQAEFTMYTGSDPCYTPHLFALTRTVPHRDTVIGFVEVHPTTAVRSIDF